MGPGKVERGKKEERKVRRAGMEKGGSSGGLVPSLLGV